jgi:hypothetical protein
VVFTRHLETFAGLPVVELTAGEPLPTVDGPVAWRFGFWEFEDDYGPSEQYARTFGELLDGIDTEQVRALVLGSWGYAAFNDAPIDLLAASAARLPNLAALFLGDMLSEESELSWIRLGDLTPLLNAYPKLQVLGVRGSSELLALQPVRHPNLRRLIFESGGLSSDVLGAVLACDLPALDHLELWLGVQNYGGDITTDDLQPLLAGARFPALNYLGLRNGEQADQVAGALAGAPIVGRLHDLDLSLGVMGDEGADALLAGQPLTHLRRLDLHHNFLSAQMAAKVVEELPGVEVDVSDQQEEEQWGRFTAVSE